LSYPCLPLGNSPSLSLLTYSISIKQVWANCNLKFMSLSNSPVLISVIKEKGKLGIKLLEKLSLSALSFECFYKNAKKMHFSLNYKFLIRTRPYLIVIINLAWSSNIINIRKRNEFLEMFVFYWNALRWLAWYPDALTVA
jgi:hypothetical protein